MTRKRERVVWWPEWTEEYQKWSASFIHKNKWRCDQVNDFDDLMQEAYLLFRHIAASYPRIVDPNYFFALYKRAMVNKMHDRSCRLKRRRGTPEAPISTDVYEIFSGRIGEVTNSGFMLTLLSELPEEMKMVLTLLANGKLDPPKPRPGVMQPREHISSRLISVLKDCGYAGLAKHWQQHFADPTHDLKKLLA